MGPLLFPCTLNQRKIFSLAFRFYAVNHRHIVCPIYRCRLWRKTISHEFVCDFVFLTKCLVICPCLPDRCRKRRISSWRLVFRLSSERWVLRRMCECHLPVRFGPLFIRWMNSTFFFCFLDSQICAKRTKLDLHLEWSVWKKIRAEINRTKRVAKCSFNR